MADKPNLDQLMQMAKKMQEGMEDIQTAMAKTEIVGEAGAGMVKVTLNGQYDCKHVDISDSAIKEDKAVLQDLLAAAFNSASEKVKGLSKDAMMDIYRQSGSPFGDAGSDDE